MCFKDAIFDLDGTLIDTAPDILNCIALAYDEVTGKIPENIEVGIIGPPLQDVFKNLTPDLTKTAIDKLVLAFSKCYDNCSFKRTKPYDQTVKLLHTLINNGISIFIATNKRRSPTLRLLESMGMPNFKEIITVDSRGTNLDKREMLDTIIKNCRLNKLETVYIGDRGSDIISAKLAGIASIAVLWGYGTESAIRGAKPDFVVANTEELQRILLPSSPRHT